MKNRIEEIKEGIRKNSIIKQNVEEKIKSKFNAAQKTGSKKDVEKVLFAKNGDQSNIVKKNEMNRSEEFGKVIEKNIKISTEKNSEIEQNNSQVNRNDLEIVRDDKASIIKNSSNKEPISPTLNLNLEKEIASSEFKIEKIESSKQYIEQYNELSDKILNKVGNVIKYMTTKGGGESVSIKLQPPELGKIQVELFLKDNTVNAKINTENIAVKEIILTNLDQLKAGIENNGFNINKLDVEIGGFKNFLSKDAGNFQGKNKNDSKNPGGGNSNTKGTETINKPLNPYVFFVGRSINVLV